MLLPVLDRAPEASDGLMVVRHLRRVQQLAAKPATQRLAPSTSVRFANAAGTSVADLSCLTQVRPDASMNGRDRQQNQRKGIAAWALDAHQTLSGTTNGSQ